MNHRNFSIRNSLLRRAIAKGDGGFDIRYALSLAAALVATLPLGGLSAAEPAKPNIVIILADDLGYGDLTCYNPESKAPSPNIDKLAAEGMRFTDAHTPSPICSPTRYSLLTGKYPWRHPVLSRGIVHGHLANVLMNEKITLPMLLRNAGFATACVGKWHLGWGAKDRDKVDRSGFWNGDLSPGPTAVGFDYYFGVPTVNSQVPEVFVENNRIVGLDPADPITLINHTKRMEGGTAARYEHGHIDDNLAVKACEWLDRQHARNPEQPFFLYFATCSVHTPIKPNPRFKGQSKGGGPRCDFLMEHDWVVGQVLDKLDELGVKENTLVIYSSDNGGSDQGGQASQYGHKLNGDLRGMKTGLWEGGHRVPFIVRWPGITPVGKTNDALICLTDMMATLASITGQSRPESAIDSFDQSPLFRGSKPSSPIREIQIAKAYWRRFVSVRVGNWKWIPDQYSGGWDSMGGGWWGTGKTVKSNSSFYPDFDPSLPPQQLYNLAEDPGETNNLYSTHPEKVEEMKKVWEQIKARGPAFNVD